MQKNYFESYPAFSFLNKCEIIYFTCLEANATVQSNLVCVCVCVRVCVCVCVCVCYFNRFLCFQCLMSLQQTFLQMADGEVADRPIMIEPADSDTEESPPTRKRRKLTPDVSEKQETSVFIFLNPYSRNKVVVVGCVMCQKRVCVLTAGRRKLM